MGAGRETLQHFLEPIQHLGGQGYGWFLERVLLAFQAEQDGLQILQSVAHWLLGEIVKSIRQVGDRPSFLRRSLVRNEKQL